jgi:aldehyde:ferredoxin oxidoreductase
MPKGYRGILLRVDLTARTIEKVEFPEEFYRTYMGGGAVGAYFLLKETPANLDALDPRNVLTIAPSVTTGCAVSGVSRCSAVALSPLTGAVGEGQVGGEIGPLIKLAGYDAIVVVGRSERPSFLFVDEGSVEIRDAGRLTGRSVSEVHDILNKELGREGARLTVLQCGPAGEKRVRYAGLMVDRNDAVGRTGMGAVMGGKNLRAVVIRVPRKTRLEFADPEGLKRLAALAGERVRTADFPSTLRAHGTPGVVTFHSESGNMATHNYSRGRHERYKDLAGEVFAPRIGAGETTCFGCVVACRKRVRAEGPYAVSDKLGGPEFETLSTLGCNLDITEITAVARANEMCNEYGIDTITMGAVAAYVFESMERGRIPPGAMEGKTLGFGRPEDLFWLIDRVGRRDGVGDVLAEGFAASIRHFGEATAPYAIHCKGQGLPAHLAQVKPSQAIIYATAPIGGDHMSSEHDWLIAGGGELYRALGIIGKGTRTSADLAKVRMTAYSQHYYSLLDTLTLCMFVWGPGNLFTYREVEDLLCYTTGWPCTFWELMKVGERKTNMMRQVNARRGFTRKDDLLPDRLYEPLPDGPSQGAHVDQAVFPTLLDQYYGVMGWDLGAGNPSPGKLMELGLEWAL